MSLAPCTRKSPPKVVTSTLFPRVISPCAPRVTLSLLLVPVISALTTISSEAKRTKVLVAVFATDIALDTVIVPTSLTSPFTVDM